MEKKSELRNTEEARLARRQLRKIDKAKLYALIGITPGDASSATQAGPAGRPATEDPRANKEPDMAEIKTDALSDVISGIGNLADKVNTVAATLDGEMKELDKDLDLVSDITGNVKSARLSLRAALARITNGPAE